MADNDSRLTLIREITRSGIATVWEGFDSGLDRKVLVKSIHPQYARESDLRVRFEREAKAIAKLSHPNVVQIYDIQAGPDELSLILEFVEGTTLRKVMKERGKLPVEAAVSITEDILAGLDHAHAAGIIHRDLKPENVLVSTRGEVKITDFGLASLKDQPSVTLEGMVVGTPSYMAPEQAEGAELSMATDIFAMGLILFEMLTGQRVHEGTAMAEILQNVLKYQPPRFEDHSADIPVALQPVLARMLERTPERRYATAAEARQALLAAGGEDRLSPVLVKDYLASETMRKPTKPSVARVRAWAKPLRFFTIATLVLAGAALVFHFATLTRDRGVPSEPFDSSVVTTPTDTAITTPVSSDTSQTASKVDSIPTAPVEPPRRRPVDTTVTHEVIDQKPVKLPEFGFLEISTRPWAQVFINDSLIGNTPLTSPSRLLSGSYSVVFMNPEIDLPVVRRVNVTGGDTTQLRVNLYENVARIRIASVKPWADVYIDGVFELRTPSSKTIFRPLGSYTISLRNPDFPEYSEALTFQEGDPIREIRVDLTKPH